MPPNRWQNLKPWGLKPNSMNDQLHPISPNYVGAYLGKGIQLYNLLEWALLQTGKANITIMTFSISEEFIRKIYQLKNSGLISEISVMIDFKAIQKTRSLEKLAGNVFTEMYYAKTHAKLVLIENSKHQLSIVGSQNFTKGNREESGIITNEQNAFLKYQTEIQRILQTAIKAEIGKIVTPIVPKIKKTREQRQNFSFSVCNATLTTQGIEYYALFRNIKMDLEFLKSSPQHIEMFIMPLLNFIKQNNINQIVHAPAGLRTTKYGFHFVTEILNKCRIYTNFEIINAFVNENNKIKLVPNAKYSPDAWIFDDIVTRGNTLRKMAELTGLKNKFILICNQ